MGEELPAKCEFSAKDLIVRLQMTIAGTIPAIDPAATKIMEIVREMSCARDHEWEIEFAIREALANAVKHGCGNNPEKTVQISVGCDQTRGMIIVVKDPGTGFDPAELPSPIVGDQVYAEGGRGIFLINQLMDEVRFRQKGTEIWMRKK
jgi:serine/threonine-protein kinase RsbW